MRGKHHQHGISFLGLLFVGALVAMTATVTVQVIPTVIEYSAVQKAAQRASGGQSVQEVRELFDKQAEVDSIKSISSKDIEISKEGDRVVVAFAYQREIHLAGPAYLTLKYAGRSK
jgi:hypothetical protein